MTSQPTHSDTTTTTPNPTRTLATWLRATERLLAAERAAVLDREGVSGRDWRLLSRLADDPSHPRARGPKLRRLQERRWIERHDGSWRLTDAGRAAHDRLRAAMDGLTATITEALSPDELDTTVAALRKITVALGWDEETPLPRRPHRTHRRAARGGCGGHPESRDGRPDWRGGHPEWRGEAPYPFAGGRERRHPADVHPHEPRGGRWGERWGQDHPHRGRMMHRAFERGFDAGFSRGRGEQ